MGEVARIAVPDPPALTPTLDGSGAETQAQPYRLFVPNVATEPLVMEAPDGTQFRWMPTELVYGDQSGLVDYIAGSAPATLTTRGREARYHRTFPASDEVHIAQAEGRKYWLILHEPPRPPADWLTEGLWFGVSGMVGGIPLPPGRHETMESMGFRFPQVFAEDLMGVRVQGWYEVVDTDQGQQLFVCIPADWLLSDERVYPVKVDPTVITGIWNWATAFPNQRRIDRFSNGVLLAVVSPLELKCRYSNDGGQTWLMPTAGEMISSSYNLLASIRIVDDRVFVIARNPSADCYLFVGVPTSSANTGYTWKTLSGVFSGAGHPDLAVHAEGSGWKVHSVAHIPGGSDKILYHRATVNSAGTPTSDGTSVTVQVAVSTNIIDAAIDVDQARNLHVTCSSSGVGAGKGIRYRAATYSGGSWTWGPMEAVTESEYATRMGSCRVDSQGRVMVTFRSANNGYIKVFRRNPSGGWADISPPNQTGENPTFALGPNDEIYLIYTNSGLKMRKYDGATWSNEVTWDSDPTCAYPTARRDALGGGVDVVYTKGTDSQYTVASYRLSLNQPPYAATVTVGSAAFDAGVGTDITIQHNDPDGDPMGAWALKRVYGSITEWWNNSTKQWQATEVYNAGSGTSYTIPAADNAGKWTTGVVYQLYASTKDNSGVVGPYSEQATVVNVGATPVVIVTGPTGTVSSGEAVVTWTCDVATSAFRVRMLDGQGQQVFDTGKKDGANVRAYTVTGLQNGQTYTPEVTVWDTTAGGGVPSAPTLGAPFDVIFTPPNPVRNLVALADHVNGAVKLTWSRDEVGVTQPEIWSGQYAIYRDGKRIAVVSTPETGDPVYFDRGAGSGKVHTYSVRALGSNGTIGPEVTTAGSVAFTDWRFDPVDGQQQLRFAYNTLVDWHPEEDVQVPETQSRYRRVYRSPAFPRVANIQAVFRDQDGLTAQEWRELLLEYIRQGVVGYLRSPQGDVWRGVFLNPSVRSHPHFAREGIACVFRETREAVVS